MEMGFATARVVQRLAANDGNFDAAMVALLSDTADAAEQMNVAGDEGGDDEAKTMQSGVLESHSSSFFLACVLTRIIQLWRDQALQH